MSTRRMIIVSLAALGLCLPSLRAEAGKPDKKARVLFLTQSKGFRHGSVNRNGRDLAPAEIAMKQLGQQTGLFEVHSTQDAAADFTVENLKKYDIVMLYTTGELPISDEAREYFVNGWLKQKGHGVIGFHSATDTFRTTKPEHKWYQEIIGGTFNGHPWGSGSKVTVTVHDTKHPAMQPFGAEFEIQDEIYQYINWVPKNVHVLMSINMAKTKIKKPYHVPIAWAREWGEGRIFYTNLGHRNETWTNKTFLNSTEGAVRWVMGLENADVTPNPKVSQAQEEKAKADAGS